MKASKYLTPALYSAAILLAFCGPLATSSSISTPNFGLKTASNCFLSSGRAGMPTTILPSRLASCRLFSHSFFQSVCASALPTDPKKNRAKRATEMKRHLFRAEKSISFLLRGSAYFRICSAKFAPGTLTLVYLSSRWFLTLLYSSSVRTSLAAWVPYSTSHLVSTSRRRVDALITFP